MSYDPYIYIADHVEKFTRYPKNKPPKKIKEAGSTFEQLLSGGGRYDAFSGYREEVQRLKSANITLTQEMIQYKTKVRDLEAKLNAYREKEKSQGGWSQAAHEYKRKADEERQQFEKFRQQYKENVRKAKNFQEEMEKQKMQKPPFPSDREMIAFLHAFYQGSYEGRQFIDSLKEWFDNRGSFTEKQRQALKRFYDNCNP